MTLFFRVNKKLRTWVSSIDVFEDWLVAGYGSGDVAIFRVRENDTNQYPFYSFNAHSRPVSSVQFHPSDVSKSQKHFKNLISFLNQLSHMIWAISLECV